jgi:hypothetical protein
VNKVVGWSDESLDGGGAKHVAIQILADPEAFGSKSI